MAVNQISTKTLVAGGALAPVAFVVAALIQGAVRPGYDPVRHFVSLLSLGEGGWIQIVNFVATGILVAGFGLGLRRQWPAGSGARWVPRLVILTGVGFVICGVFVADPALGYPPGTPAGLPTGVSWHGAVHYLGAALIFLGLPAAMAIAARRAPSRSTRTGAAYSLASALLMVAGWIAGFALTDPTGAIEVAGLLQRIAVVAGFQWLVVTAVLELRRFRSVPAAAPAYA